MPQLISIYDFNPENPFWHSHLSERRIKAFPPSKPPPHIPRMAASLPSAADPRPRWLELQPSHSPSHDASRSPSPSQIVESQLTNHDSPRESPNPRHRWLELQSSRNPSNISTPISSPSPSLPPLTRCNSVSRYEYVARCNSLTRCNSLPRYSESAVMASLPATPFPTPSDGSPPESSPGLPPASCTSTAAQPGTPLQEMSNEFPMLQDGNETSCNEMKTSRDDDRKKEKRRKRFCRLAGDICSVLKQKATPWKPSRQKAESMENTNSGFSAATRSENPDSAPETRTASSKPAEKSSPGSANKITRHIEKSNPDAGDTVTKYNEKSSPNSGKSCESNPTDNSSPDSISPAPKPNTTSEWREWSPAEKAAADAQIAQQDREESARGRMLDRKAVQKAVVKMGVAKEKEDRKERKAERKKLGWGVERVKKWAGDLWFYGLY